jgi:TonB-linked SusC/RagA family outer membrane protein
MEKYKKIIIILLMVFSVTHLFAQGTRTIKGKVTDENGGPLAEVTVIGDEGDVYTTTDKEGNYTIAILFSEVVLIEKDGFISKQVLVNDVLAKSTIVLTKPDFLTGEKDLLQLPFRQLAAKRSTGSATKIDVVELQTYDARKGLDAALSGKVAGLYGSKDIWGRGNAVVVVDGVPRTDDYDVNLIEIESVTVLKDPVSRSLYGATGDQGVIMVKTKRGKAYKKVMNLQAEYGVSQPISNTFPKYMNAADYMQAINGINPTKPVYSDKKITDTRNGIMPALNPDVDFYSSEFVRPQTEFHSIVGESSGGNKAAQYYLNLGWQHNNGWMNVGKRETTDKLNIRGNVDYQLSDNFKMNLDAGALVNIINGSNIPDYWNTATSTLPNAYPLYWDPAIITSPAKQKEILSTAVLLPNGMLAGGNKTYPGNFYGDIFKKGDRVTWERNLQINVGAEWNLKALLPGLKAKGYLALDSYNTLVKVQSGLYAVYNPLLLQSKINPAMDSVGVEVIGLDQKVSNFSPVSGDMYFYRNLAMYSSLSYDETFGKTDVSLLAVAYRSQFATKQAKQEQRNLTFGLNGNMMHNQKYILDFSLGLLGSQKLTEKNRLTFAPSLGLGWIISEEDFMADNKVIDYLKLRATAGILKNDNWSDYYLHTSAYGGSSTFNYNNGNNSNNERSLSNLSSNIGWQKRREMTLGFDASMFEKKLWLESSVFYTERYDLITELANQYPLLAGTNTEKYYGNFDADRIQGIDLGIKYNAQLTSDLFLMVGSTLVIKSEKTLKRDEPNYVNDYQYNAGTRTNSHWGLASEGLYGANDFDGNGKLLSTLPAPGWGAVAPGDIKYIDWNKDGKIDSEDEHIIGRSGADFQYSVYINLKFKQFEFYAIGTGYQGGNNMRTGNYYRSYGTSMKFPEHLKTAYSAANPDVYALYPRLTATSSTHNFRNSDFWMFNANSFSIPTMQLTYNYIGKSTSVVKDAKFYFKASNLIRYNTHPEFVNVSLSAPKTYSFSVGSIFTF